MVRVGVFGIDPAAVREYDLFLLPIELIVRLINEPLPYRRTAYKVLVHDPLDHVGFDVLVDRLGVILMDLDEDVPGAEPQAAHLMGSTVLFYRGRNAGPRQSAREGLEHLPAACCDPGRPHADPYDGFFSHLFFSL